MLQESGRSQTKRAETESVEELDQQRDADVQALFDSIRPYAAARALAEKTAYSQLAAFFGSYKDIIKKANYEKESALIAEVLKKLAAAPYSEAIGSLRLTGFVENLSESQMQFERVFAERQALGLTKVSYDRKKLRQDVEKPYQLLCAYLEVAEAIQPAPERKLLLATINNSRKYYADLLARRKVSKKESTQER